jgi:signal transduction histidine kinase/CheY-like chemotaxis protein
MEPSYIRVIVLLHAAFAGVFYFLNRQHPSRFARLIAWSWTIEAIRAAMLLPGVRDQGGWSAGWYDSADILCLFANWCLLAGCADLTGVRVRAWLAPVYFGVSVPLLVFDRFFFPGILSARFGVPMDRALFYGGFQNLVIMFVPVAVTRTVIVFWLVQTWRKTRLPGALIATIFCVPYAGFALAAPIQYYYAYYPEWTAVTWCARVLGFSIGLVMLRLNQQLDAVRKSESGLAAAQASAKLGSWEYTVATGASLWSAELFKLFDRDPALGPASFAELVPQVHVDDRPAFGRNFVQALTASRGHHAEYRLVRPDGRMQWMEVRNELVLDPEGQPERMAGTVQDITDKKQMEEQFLRAQRAENLGLLAAGIAHDFNNILTPILMVSPILRERVHDSSDRKFLTMIEKSAERGAALVRQILSFVHGTGGQRILVQPKHIVREVASMVSETFPRSIKHEQSIASSPWPVMANPTQLHQILLNLCVNARDAMPAGGTLCLRLKNCALDQAGAAAIPDGRAGNFVVLEVADTGLGIPPDILPRIWEPFFSTKGPEKGTGLGLATVRGIVGSHDGFCQVETKLAEGTTFRIYLPATETDLPAETGGNPPLFAPRGQGELVLIVDDEAHVRDFTSATLASHGYRVLVAGDGVEGLALFTSRANDVSLVVADWHMPRLGGEAFALAVRRLKPAQRLLVMSGLSSGGGGSTPVETGDAFLPKPFKPSALLAVVHRLLQPDPGLNS